MLGRGGLLTSENGPVLQLGEAWAQALRDAGATAEPAAVSAAGAAVLARWREPHRRHPDVEHLTEVIEAVDLLAGEAGDLAAVRLAAWFHDAVYDGRPGDDEERSALLAERLLADLGVTATRTAAVAGLVRMTATHQVPEEPAAGLPYDPADAHVLSDADLAILGADADRYARYAAAIRAEYAAVPDEQFRRGRAAVLGALVGAPRLYRTGRGRQLWERQARSNVAAELAQLDGRRA